jgi:hypothetical protein
MIAVEILARVTQARGEVIPNGDTLKVRAPQPLPDELRQAIRAHKAALLSLLAPRACHFCQAAGQPALNYPELLCPGCGEVVGYLTPRGVEDPVENLPSAQYEFAGGMPRVAAEALAQHGQVVGLPACPRCHGMTYQYANGYIRCTTPWCGFGRAREEKD